MAQRSRQRPAAAGQGGGSGRREAKASADGGAVVRIGSIRVHLGRIPELLLLIALAFYVARTCTDLLDVTFPAAVPMGLFAARMTQKLLAWLNSGGDEE
mmetsp:Transcript_9473/g.25686  ORF Transcript_9473/g.25686 Transcript_9473/m.25686 type:complete len:99 (-) Transcript_9473:152-448(-)